MEKRFIILIMFLAIFMNACETRQPSTPDDYSPTHPSPLPYVDVDKAASTPSPYANNTPFASPTIEIIDTPTFSPTLTPIPTLKPDQARPLINIQMMDELNGWGIEENGHIVHTKDGGITWGNVTPPQGVYNEDGFFALDAQTAWATPYCRGFLFGSDNPYFCEGSINQTNVWITHDGGRTWEIKSQAPIARVPCLIGTWNICH